MPRSNAAPCDAQKNRDDCLTTTESRTLELHGNQLKDSICVWCKQPCTPDNDNQCEPQAFLDGYEKAKPGITKNYDTCLAGNAHLRQLYNSYAFLIRLWIEIILKSHFES